MMKLINNLKIILLTLVAIVSVSCLKDEVIDFGKGPAVVQFQSKELFKNFVQDGNDKVYDLEIPITYFGNDNSFDKDITLTVAINTGKTTATEGTEFSLSETSVTIPAGANTAMAKLKVNSANLDPSASKVVALEIVDSSGSISENKNIILITLQAICLSDLAGDWKYSDGNGRSVTITEIGTGIYTISADNNYGDLSFDISDVCGNLTVIRSDIQDKYGDTVTGSGTVKDSNTIELKYTDEGYFTDRVMTLHKN